MLVCVWLVSSLIHMISGCSLSAPTEVTGYTGGSVVLPCYCTGGQPTPNTARWFFFPNPSNIKLWSYPNEVHDRYKDRVIFSATPGNLSLRLSDLTPSDGGTYRCAASATIYEDIILTVKAGCVLSHSEPMDITGLTGDSVILPCACTDVQRKPRLIKWTVHKGGQRPVILSQGPGRVNDRYKQRVQVLDSGSPGNLSLLLSDLTLSDGGPYRCEADGHHRDIRLTVKGCVLSDSKPIDITGFTGDSVVLPCACTDVQRKPEKIKWTAYPGGQSPVILSQSPRRVNDHYKQRVQVLNSISPGNLSLLLSDLTQSDEGSYRCDADGNYRDISLTVKGELDGWISEDLKNSILYATIAAVVAAVAVCGAVLFYRRVRSRRNAHVESREEQEMGTGEQVEEKNADSVTYSTVVHSKTVKNTNIQNQSEDFTEYAAIKLGMSSNL